MLKPIKHFCYAAIVTSLLFPQVPAYAQDLPSLIWSDRVSLETTDGEIKETAPIVEIGTVRLSRFSQMRSVTLQHTVMIGEGDDAEALFAFRVWQGGASQGEQLMLVTVSALGVDVIGPYQQDFESFEIRPTKGDMVPIFELHGIDKNKPLARLEYFDGQLIKLID